MPSPARFWPALSLALSLLILSSAAAQKNCKKGIPCGNTRISATKTCRIGTSPTTVTAPRSLTAGQPRDEHGRYIRSRSAKARFMRLTGYPNGRPGYVVDHIIPLACGGPDTPENMQWQTREAAKAKDAVERRDCPP